ncbi:MAG: hypothetical protein ABIH29_01995 [Candidatus Micrarchaeota archaeon]
MQVQASRSPGRRLSRAAVAAAAVFMLSCGSAISDRLGGMPGEDIVYCDMCGLQEVFDSQREVFERIGGVSDVEMDIGAQVQRGTFRFRITGISTFLEVLGRSYDLPGEMSLATSIIVTARISQPFNGSGASPFQDDGRRIEIVPLDQEKPVIIQYTVDGETRETSVEVGRCLNDLFFGHGTYTERRWRIGREGSADPSGFCERY